MNKRGPKPRCSHQQLAKAIKLKCSWTSNSTNETLIQENICSNCAAESKSDSTNLTFTFEFFNAITKKVENVSCVEALGEMFNSSVNLNDKSILCFNCKILLIQLYKAFREFTNISKASNSYFSFIFSLEKKQVEKKVELPVEEEGNQIDEENREILQNVKFDPVDPNPLKGIEEENQISESPLNNSLKEKDSVENETDFDENEENDSMTCEGSNSNNTVINHEPSVSSPQTLKEKSQKVKKPIISQIRRSSRIPKPKRIRDEDINLEESLPFMLLNKMKSKEFPTADITCHICLKKFFNQDHINEHMSIEHEGSKYKCRFCSGEFSTLGRLVKHRKIHTSKFFCSQCSFATRTEKLLEKHTEKHKKNDGESLDAPVNYPCSECGKEFTKKNYLKKHVIDMHKEKKHECPECEKRFASKRDLLEHSISHIREEIETRVKPWQCQFCAKRFEKEIALRRHISFMHSESRPFICEHPDCGKSFVKMEFLRNHEVAHTQNKDHLCYECGKSFKRPYALFLHGFVHKPESELPFGCHTCGKRFLRKSRLLSHQIKLGHKRDDIPDEIQNLVIETRNGASKPREPKEKVPKTSNVVSMKVKKPRRKRTKLVAEEQPIQTIAEIQTVSYEQIVDFAEFVVIEDPGINFTIQQLN